MKVMAIVNLKNGNVIRPKMKDISVERIEELREVIEEAMIKHSDGHVNFGTAVIRMSDIESIEFKKMILGVF